MTDNFERALQERLLARSQVSPRDVEALRLFARTLPARRSFWRGPVLRFAMTAAAVALAVAVAVPVLQRLPGFGSTPSPTPVPTTPVVVFPTGPVPTPTAPATPAPSLGAGVVRLLTASGSDVIVEISDLDGVLTGAEAEQAEDTMSVRWFDAIVERVSPSSVRITWIGFPRDETFDLTVDVTESGGILVHIVQQAPPPASDGVGEDRVLVLEFNQNVDPADVEVTFDYPA